MQDQKRIERESGYALLMVMLILLVMTLFGTSLLTLSISNSKMNRAEQNYQAAYYVAEAGLRHHIESMRSKMEELYEDGYWDTNKKDDFFQQLKAIKTSIADFEEMAGPQASAQVTGSLKSQVGNRGYFLLQAVGKVGNVSRKVESHVMVEWYPYNPEASSGLDPSHPVLDASVRAAVLSNGNLNLRKNSNNSYTLIVDGSVYCNEAEGTVNSIVLKRIAAGEITSEEVEEDIDAFFKEVDDPDLYYNAGYRNNGQENKIYPNNNTIEFNKNNSTDGNGVFGTPDQPIFFLTPPHNDSSKDRLEVRIHNTVEHIYGIVCIDGDLVFHNDVKITGALIVRGNISVKTAAKKVIEINHDMSVIRKALSDPKYASYFGSIWGIGEDAIVVEPDIGE